MQGKGALTIWILTGVLGFLLASCRGWEMVWSGQPIKWWLTVPVGLLRLLPRQSETNMRIWKICSNTF